MAGDDEGSAIDAIVLRALEVGLHESIAYLYHEQPTLAEFERWILAKNGGSIAPERIVRINAAVEGEPVPTGDDDGDPVLSPADLAFWDEHGYVVFHDAVSPQQCADAVAAICAFLGADPRDPQTWYRRRNGHSIWVPLLHDPALWGIGAHRGYGAPSRSSGAATTCG